MSSCRLGAQHRGDAQGSRTERSECDRNYRSEQGDPALLACILRLLAPHNIFREVTLNVFTNNRISSTLDKGKSSTITEAIVSEVSSPGRTETGPPPAPLAWMLGGGGDECGGGWGMGSGSGRVVVKL
ncbi:hypothetical protein C8R44DRAFT_738320 [Mycena epipterygia]|nr:hypothetical protein C8R44DRAFT_738320 [Mycena epipterygia]